MARSATSRYGAQGGGLAVPASHQMGQQDPEHLAGIHLIPPIGRAGPGHARRPTPTPSGRQWPPWSRQRVGGRYFGEAGHRPQTLGRPVTRRPPGCVAGSWRSFGHGATATANPETVFTRDEMLDNITLVRVHRHGRFLAGCMWYWRASTVQSCSPVNRTPLDVPNGVLSLPEGPAAAVAPMGGEANTDIGTGRAVEGWSFRRLRGPDISSDEVSAFRPHDPLVRVLIARALLRIAVSEHRNRSAGRHRPRRGRCPTQRVRVLIELLDDRDSGTAHRACDRSRWATGRGIGDRPWMVGSAWGTGRQECRGSPAPGRTADPTAHACPGRRTRTQGRR